MYSHKPMKLIFSQFLWIHHFSCMTKRPYWESKSYPNRLWCIKKRCYIINRALEIKSSGSLSWSFACKQLDDVKGRHFEGIICPVFTAIHAHNSVVQMRKNVRFVYLPPTRAMRVAHTCFFWHPAWRGYGSLYFSFINTMHLIKLLLIVMSNHKLGSSETCESLAYVHSPNFSSRKPFVLVYFLGTYL